MVPSYASAWDIPKTMITVTASMHDSIVFNTGNKAKIVDKLCYAVTYA